MSYGPPQGNQGYYSGPPQGGPGYGPPPGQFNQGGYPPQGYPPQQQGGYPPQGDYGGPPQQGGYGGPPQQDGYPPQGGYGGPPQQGGYGGPPQQGGYPQQAGYGGPQGGHPAPQGYGGPQQGFGGQPQSNFPPQQGYGGPPQQPMGMPSPGYDPRAAAQGDASHDADALRKAMKGFGTDEAVLIRILSKPDPLQMALLRNTYSQRIKRNLEHDVESETSSHFKEGLGALVRGPLGQDVFNVKKAIKGLGTKESVLNDVLIGRSNADMNAIKQAYRAQYGKTLESDVEGDLSMKTKRLFSMIMAGTRAEESAPIIPQQLDQEVMELHRATEGKIGTDEIAVCAILSSKSDAQLRAIAQQFHEKFQRSLPKVIKKEFTGHMEDALLLMVNRALDRAMCDAMQLEETMKGAGTKDNLLVNRVVRLHWNRQAMDQAKKAYLFQNKKDLIQRVRGETSGDYQKLLVACLE